MNEVSKQNQQVAPAASIPPVAKTPSNTIGDMLEKYRTKISQALPRHIGEKVFMRILHTEIARNPTLMKCTAPSLIGCLLQVAQLGLIPDSLTGEAYLIPYHNRKKGTYECTLQIGYKGCLSLCYRSGQVMKVSAHEVRENDIFSFEYGTNEHIKFIPMEGDRGKITHYFALAELKNGAKQFVVCTLDDINEHRKFTKTNNSDYSPWATHFSEMAKKTMIKKVLKYLPKSAENLNLYEAIAIDDRAESGSQDEVLPIDDLTIIEGEEVKHE